MPVTDAITYLHGSGTTAYGPVTSTANVIATGSQSGTVVTISTITSGQFGVGQSLSGPGLVANTIITSLGTGAGGAGTYNVSQSATVASLAGVIAGPPTYGDAITASGYSNLEIDFGAPQTGGSYPYLTQFPSLTEKGYANPAEVVGSGTTPLGIHFIVGGGFNLLTSMTVDVCTSPVTQATYNSAGNPIAARTFSLAQLQSSGANYWIPIPGSAIQEFLRLYFVVNGTTPTAGTVTAWFGPLGGGEQ